MGMKVKLLEGNIHIERLGLVGAVGDLLNMPVNCGGFPHFYPCTVRCGEHTLDVSCEFLEPVDASEVPQSHSRCGQRAVHAWLMCEARDRLYHFGRWAKPNAHVIAWQDHQDWQKWRQHHGL